MELPESLQKDVEELETVTGQEAEEVLRQALDNYKAEIGKQLVSQQAQAQKMQQRGELEVETEDESAEVTEEGA